MKAGLRTSTMVALRDELANQRRKWGVQHHTDANWLAILVEEVGEAAKSMLEDGGDDGRVSAELIQVAAVAVAWLQDREIGR